MKNSLAFVSNITTQPFTRHLQDFNVFHHPLNSVQQTLRTICSSDFLIIMLDHKYFFWSTLSLPEIENRTSHLAALCAIFRSNNKAKLLIANIAHRFLDFCTSDNISQYLLLLELNTRLQSIANQIPDCAIVNVFDCMLLTGAHEFNNNHNRYHYQAPFTHKALEIISAEIRKKTSMLSVTRKKLCILDADNTLWGGTVGEDGVSGIAIDENIPGIIYREFQHQLLLIKNTGVLLALCSRNNFDEVQAVFEQRAMPLQWSDFSAIRINWNPKSQNIREIAAELKVGFENMVFLDDSEFEIAEVCSSIPEISAYKLSQENCATNLSLLPTITELNTLKYTEEDALRSQYYIQEQARKQYTRDAVTNNDFLHSFDIQIEYFVNNRKHISRIAQLFQRTNQFTMTTRRYSETEVALLMGSALVVDCKVIDKFGDMGTVGVAVIREGLIDSFLLSCRVLGRNIEAAFLKIVCEVGKLNPIRIEFIESSKNAPAKNFLLQTKFEKCEVVGSSTVFELKTIIANAGRYSIKQGKNEL